MQNEGDWEPVRLLSTAARLVRRDVDNRLRAIGLTQERVTVLRVRAAEGPMRRAELARRLRNTPAEELRTTRIRVPNPVKARIAARAVLTRRTAARPVSARNGRQA